MNKYEAYTSYMYQRYKLIKTLMTHFPTLMIQIKYFKKLRRFANIKHPKTYNEKNQWMKLYYNTPLMERVADKIKLRDYLLEKGLKDYSVPLLNIYNNYSEIDFNRLPNQFVIKTNHGSGFNKIILDKSKINHKELKALFDYYMKLDYSYFNHELVYKNIEPRIIIEPYLGELIDYKIMCTNHDILYTVSLKRYSDGHYDEGFYDKNWDKSLGGFKHIKVLDPKIKPERKEDMNRIARLISQDFLQVRVDFYEVNNRIYISELTFFSESGMLDFEPRDVDQILGHKFKLPQEHSL